MYTYYVKCVNPKVYLDRKNMQVEVLLSVLYYRSNRANTRVPVSIPRVKPYGFRAFLVRLNLSMPC